MSENGAALAERVRSALESADLDAFADLLAPNVRWGPSGDAHSGCHNRNQVLDWYRAGRDRGVRATVVEIVPSPPHLLVGLHVTGTTELGDRSGGGPRWQVLTVKDGLIVDIRGFEERGPAATFAGVAPTGPNS